MSRRPIFVLLFGLLFCFCLFAKQASQSYDFITEPLSVQDVVVENSGTDEFVDSGDDLLPFPYVFVVTFIFVLVFASPLRKYAQPPIRSLQRPPSI